MLFAKLATNTAVMHVNIAGLVLESVRFSNQLITNNNKNFFALIIFLGTWCFP